MCDFLADFQNEKIRKLEQNLSDKEKFDLKCDRDENGYRAIVTAKNMRSVYEIYLQVCLTERFTILPMQKAIGEQVKLPSNEHTKCNELNIVDILKADCLLKIFSYLDLNDLFEMAFVCTDFQALVAQDKRVKRMRDFHFKFYDKYFAAEGEKIFSDKSVEKMKKILECTGNNLQDICITVGRTSNEFRIFETMIRNVGFNLTTLRLCNFCWLPMIFENSASSVFGQIETLTLDSQYYDIPITVDIKKKFLRLKKLELHGRWKLVDFSNWSTITALTINRIISLNHTSWMTWMTDVSSHFSNLNTLIISDTMRRTVPLDNCECLLQLTQLRKIQIDILNRNCYDVLLKMTQLTTVTLIFYRLIEDVIEDNLFQMAGCLTNLKEFNLILKEEASLPREDLMAFIAMANRLESFHLINDTIRLILMAPSFLLELLEARKRTQEICSNITPLQVRFSKCFIDDSVLKVK